MRPASRTVFLCSALTLLAGLAAAVESLAQPAYRVADLTTAARQQASWPLTFHFFDGAVVFTAEEEETGRELWLTDGTAAGTALVADLCPGPCNARPRMLGVVADRLVFQATDGTSGRELWSLRRGEAPRRLGDLCSGSCDGVGDEAVLLDGALYFAGRDRETGVELWRTDGTAEGTTRVADVCPGPCDGAPTDLAVLEGRVYFAATDGIDGRELWASDGTAADTELVADLCSGCDGDPQALFVNEGRLFFGADDGSTGREPWMSDGTPEGTRRLADLVPGPEGSDPQAFRVLLDRLYLQNDCRHLDPCFWRLEAGTLVPALELYPDGFDRQPHLAVEWRGEIYFVSSFHLWATDGVGGNGTGARSVGRFSNVHFLTATPEVLLFSAAPYPGGSPRTLWYSNGSTLGTRPLEEVQPGVDLPLGATDTPLGTFFSAETFDLDREPWITHGRPEDARPVADVAPRTTSSDPVPRFALGERMLFSAGVPFRSHGLFATDGRPGTQEELLQGYGIRPVRIGDQAFFLRGFREREFWRTDGTAAGTVLLQELDAELDRRIPDLAALRPDGPQPRLIYGDSEEGQGVWTLNPATGEERRIANLNTRWSNEPCVFSPCEEPPRLPAAFVSTGMATGGVFFLGSEASTAIQLWWTGGTEATTRRLHTFDTGVVLTGLFFTPHGEDLFPRDFTPFGDGILFNAFEQGEGFEPWVSDGTVVGTRRLGDLWPGPETSEARAFTVQGTMAYFFARTPEGDGLWRTDGTPEGTARVAILEWQGEPVSGVRMAAVGNQVFFSAFSQETGEELWVSDGTAAGTRLVADLNPGPESAAPRELTAVEVGRRSFLLFTAGDGILGSGRGVEPWVSDGRVMRRVQDLNPGPASSHPRGFRLLGGVTGSPSRILFSADDGIHDRELWAVPVAALLRLLPEDVPLGPVRRPVDQP